MKSKKILLGSLSAMALVATPIAAVVSCDNGDDKIIEKGDDKIIEKGDDKIIESSKKGFVLQSGDDIYIPESLASKAGEIKIPGDATFKWDKALTKDSKVQKLDENGKEIKKASIKAAEESKLVIPYKDKSGVGIYFEDNVQLKRVFVDMWDMGLLNLNPQVEGNKVTVIGINDINVFLKVTKLKVEKVTTKELAKSGGAPAHTEHTIFWKV